MYKVCVCLKLILITIEMRRATPNKNRWFSECGCRLFFLLPILIGYTVSSRFRSIRPAAAPAELVVWCGEEKKEVNHTAGVYHHRSSHTCDTRRAGGFCCWRSSVSICSPRCSRLVSAIVLVLLPLGGGASPAHHPTSSARTLTAVKPHPFVCLT